MPSPLLPPSALSEKLEGTKPLRVDILGRSVVLFREAETMLPSAAAGTAPLDAGTAVSAAGRVRCLDNICPHRGAPLSEGWAKTVEGHGACVVCPYHGWAFDSKGEQGCGCMCMSHVSTSATRQHWSLEMQWAIGMLAYAGNVDSLRSMSLLKSTDAFIPAQSWLRLLLRTATPTALSLLPLPRQAS